MVSDGNCAERLIKYETILYTIMNKNQCWQIVWESQLDLGRMAGRTNVESLQVGNEKTSENYAPSSGVQAGIHV